MADTSELREEAARIIYDAFPYKGEVSPPTKPAWVVNGNSIMQTEARRAAAKILALPGLQAEAPTDAEVAEIEKRHATAYPNAMGLPDIEVVRNVVHHAAWAHSDRGTLLAKLRARTSQAEAQAPTTAAPVLTEGDIAAIKRARDVYAVAIRHATNAHSIMVSTTLGDAISLIDRLTSTVGAHAPAPTMPTREKIARVFAKDVGCDLGYSQEFVRCIREIHNCGCAKRADAILALIAKGDTP